MTIGSICRYLVIFTCFTALSVQADSPVWKVSKGGSSLYLAGTFHLLASSDYPLPSSFDKAYKAADTVYFETDSDKVNSIEFQQKMMVALMAQNGKTLKATLDAKTYQALQKYFQSRQLPGTNFEMFSASGVSLTIAVLEYQRLGMTPEYGIEGVFTKKAKSDRKKFGFFETPEEQVAFLVSMGKGRENDLVAHTLREIEKLPSMVSQMKKAWRTGDNELLESVAIKPMQSEYPSIYRSLLSDRNYNWLPKIEKLVVTPSVELVMVGAAHLAGDDGLIKLLKDKGYKVENL